MTGASHGDTGYAVTDGQSVYYLDAGSLWKLPVAGAPPGKLIDAAVMPQYNFADGPIVVDDTSVYLVAFEGQGIVKIAKRAQEEFDDYPRSAITDSTPSCRGNDRRPTLLAG